ncbi:MAG: NUDIX domain-containing protein [Mesorhizobium sp.]
MVLSLEIAEAEAKARRQVAALPMRIVAGAVEVCLVTTRQTRRWTLPKGWPMRGKKDHAAAAREAREEAGLVGRAGSKPIGAYGYWKHRGTHLDWVRVTVYRMSVKAALQSWREKAEREVVWVDPETAADMVQEEGLKDLLRGLPKHKTKKAERKT